MKTDIFIRRAMLMMRQRNSYRITSTIIIMSRIAHLKRNRSSQVTGALYGCCC